MTLPNQQGAAQVLALHASPQARVWSRAVNAYRDAEAEQLWATAIENVNATHDPRERAPGDAAAVAASRAAPTASARPPVMTIPIKTTTTHTT